MSDETATLRGWLTAIHERYGRLTPELVKEAARPEDSPAHAHVFNLPPGDAAEAYYLERAHDLIRRVRVTVASLDGAPRRVRFFYAIPGDEDTYQYEPIDVIRRAPDKYRAVQTEALRRLKDAQTAVEDLDLIAPTTDAPRTARAVKAVKQARRLVEAEVTA